MAVLTAPTYNPTSAYRPIIWQVMYTSNLANPVTNCKFTINIGADTIVGRVAPYQVVPSLTPTFYEYYFYVDVQQYIQRYLTKRGRRSTFGDLNTETRVINSDSFVEFTVDFQYEYRNSLTGKIDTFPGSDTSGNQTAGITIRQNGDDMSLDEFYGIPFLTLGERFLTDSPISRNITNTENVFLSFWGEWNYFQVTTYTSLGVQINQTYFPTTGGAANEIKTAGVGKPQLDAITAWFGAVAADFTNCAYYTVQAGMGIPLGGGSMLFLANSDLITYTFADDCSRNIRIYWLNTLGGVDHFNFPYQELSVSVSSDLYQKPLSWPHTQDDYGRSKTNIKANRAYQVTKQVTNADAAWIKDLFYSAEVYMVNPDDSSEYWRVFLSDTTVVEKRKIGIFEIGFTLNLSQDIITHRV